MEELHANFSDQLVLDDSEPQLHLKLAWSLRNKLIKKLNEHSQFGLLTKETDRMKTMDENNQIISTLDGLPVLIEDDGEESNINQDTLKFLKEVDYIKHKLQIFDAKRINIAIWFRRFECFAEMFGWSNGPRVEALTHLLGPALDRLVDEKEPKYEIIKSEIIILVNKLLNQASYTRMVDHLTQVVIPIFDENEFTNPEKRYWLGCIASPQYYMTFCANLQDYGQDLKVTRLIESQSSEVEWKKRDLKSTKMEELHSNLNNLAVNEIENQLHLKLNLGLKNKLIQKIGENSRYALLTDKPDKMKLVEENGQIIADLERLPVLIDNDGHQTNINQDALRFLKEINYIKLELGVFDARRIHIVAWFKQFEFLAEMFGWNDGQRVDGLGRLLGPALDRLAYEKENTFKYEIIKKDTIDLVNKLLKQDCLSRIWIDHLGPVVIPIFDEKQFTIEEKRHWLLCITSPEFYKRFCGICSDTGMDLKAKRFLQSCFD